VLWVLQRVPTCQESQKSFPRQTRWFQGNTYKFDVIIYTYWPFDPPFSDTRMVKLKSTSKCHLMVQITMFLISCFVLFTCLCNLHKSGFPHLQGKIKRQRSVIQLKELLVYVFVQICIKQQNFTIICKASIVSKVTVCISVTTLSLLIPCFFSVLTFLMTQRMFPQCHHQMTFQWKL